MKYKEPSDEEYLEIAQKVRSGEYFREARAMYDVGVNDFLSERYFYLGVSCLAILVFLVALYAANGLFPLSRYVPFPYVINDPIEDVPRISALRAPGETASEAVLKFLASNYVVLREQYAIQTMERNISGLRSQSSEAVFAQYKNFIDTNNQDSPARLYERHSVRNIAVISVVPVEGANDKIEVVFDATVSGQVQTKPTRHKAHITFNYSGVEFDEKTDKIKPLAFSVTAYQTNRIQDE